MKRVVCFYIPEPLARGYKIHNEFHQYRMKWKFISDSFYHMLNSQKRKKILLYRVLLQILLRKTRQRRGVTYDVIEELRRLSLSKCFPALCHKLIYEIAIFHSINRETCDKNVHVIKVNNCVHLCNRIRRKGKRSNAVVWQTSINDRQCIV